MYYLIQTDEYWCSSGSATDVKFFKQASNKSLLTKFLKSEFEKAVEDNEIESINDCEKCCIDVDDIEDDLMVQYVSEGMGWHRTHYTIVSDTEVELIEEPPEMVKCRDCGKEIPEEDAIYCNFEEDSDYLCDDCISEYEYCAVCERYFPSEKEYVYFLRGGNVCEDCYDEHGWKYE